MLVLLVVHLLNEFILIIRIAESYVSITLQVVIEKNIIHLQENPQFLCIEHDVRQPMLELFRENNISHIYHLAAPASPKIYQDMKHKEDLIVYSDLPKDDPVRRRPCIQLAQYLLSLTPKISIQQGIRKILEHTLSSNIQNT